MEDQEIFMMWLEFDANVVTGNLCVCCGDGIKTGQADAYAIFSFRGRDFTWRKECVCICVCSFSLCVDGDVTQETVTNRKICCGSAKLKKHEC